MIDNEEGDDEEVDDGAVGVINENEHEGWNGTECKRNE